MFFTENICSFCTNINIVRHLFVERDLIFRRKIFAEIIALVSFSLSRQEIYNSLAQFRTCLVAITVSEVLLTEPQNGKSGNFTIIVHSHSLL